ncbi:MAG: NADH-quinone oxidoreductase subunit J [Deferribacteres bacterium]|nr:NADH-quinone oxidoreductase subunit J [Deferribacteres bacterium]
MGIYELSFIAFGLIVFLSGVGVVALKNPVHSALALLANLTLTAVLYLSYLSAPFLGVVQIIVYVGAILVFILFVIMLMNVRKEDITETLLSPRLLFGLGAVVVFVAQILALNIFVSGSAQGAKYIHAKDIADLLFTKYVLPFELVSVLIFAAACGAIALAKKRM